MRSALLNIMVGAATKAGRSLTKDFNEVENLQVSIKGPADFVSNADRRAEEIVFTELQKARPTYGFLGEEGTEVAGTDGQHRWIVDPLDGTTNYVHGFPAYCVSIALADGDDLLVAAIHDPLRDECFTARRGGGSRLNGTLFKTPAVTDPAEAVAAVSFPAHVGPDSPAIADFIAVLTHVHSVRRTGSTALNLAYLAAGRLHAFWVRRICCWDAAAGILIAREAGGVVGSFEGGPEVIPLDDPAFIAASTPELLAALRIILG